MMKYGVQIIALAAAMSLTTPPAMGQNQDAPSMAADAETIPPDQRLNLRLTFKGEDWLAEPAWLFHGPDDTATLVAVGGTERVLKGERRRDGSYSLQLDEGSQITTLKLTPTAQGLSGRWTRGLGGGEAVAEAAKPSLLPSDFAPVFDRLTSILDARFFDPGFNGTDWAGLKDRYRARALAAPNEGVFVIAVREMLKEIGVSHLGFFNSPPHRS